MGNRLKSNASARLVRGRQRFDTWRKTHKGYHRLPDSLWSAAVRLAQTYGIKRTACTLRLESTVSKTPSEGMPGPGFIELLPSELTATAECALECRRPDETTIRIHLKASQLPDLATLSRSLCNGSPGDR